jgi:predicted transposase/invertase (TIGR01784 family)
MMEQQPDIFPFAPDPEILSPRIDFTFKALFGSERNLPLLTALLRDILDEPENEIAELQLLNPYTQKNYMDDKLGILDVKARLRTGAIIHLEIQVLSQKGMIERILYYQDKIFTEQIEAGQDYDVIKKVITVVIAAEFDLIAGTEDYHNVFWYTNPRNGVRLSDKKEIHTYELQKLPLTDDQSRAYEWMRFIAANQKEEFEMLAQNNTDIRQAYTELQRLSLSKENRAQYEDRIKALRDEQWRVNSAQRQGHEEGREEGRELMAMETAKRALRRGMEPDIIADLTGLDEKTINRLQDEMKMKNE